MMFITYQHCAWHCVRFTVENMDQENDKTNTQNFLIQGIVGEPQEISLKESLSFLSPENCKIFPIYIGRYLGMFGDELLGF